MDGSFITAKETPEDFDACWERQGVSIRRLVEIAPELVDFRDRRFAQKARFGGELFPADIAADALGTRFVDFFQRDTVRGGQQKGIVAIEIGASS